MPKHVLVKGRKAATGHDSPVRIPKIALPNSIVIVFLLTTLMIQSGYMKSHSPG